MKKYEDYSFKKTIQRKRKIKAKRDIQGEERSIYYLLYSRVAFRVSWWQNRRYNQHVCFLLSQCDFVCVCMCVHVCCGMWLAVCGPVQQAWACVMLIILSHWMTPDVTLAALASNTPETEGRKAPRWMEERKEQEWYTERERKWMRVCLCERERCVSKGPRFPQRHTDRDR